MHDRRNLRRTGILGTVDDKEAVAKRRPGNCHHAGQLPPTDDAHPGGTIRRQFEPGFWPQSAAHEATAAAMSVRTVMPGQLSSATPA